MRGILGNAARDIEAAARKILGVNFDAFLSFGVGTDWFYMPGVNPGPPGKEFASNRSHIAIRMNRIGITNERFRALRDSLVERLHKMVPDWQTYTVGVGTGFVCNQGIVGQEFI